MADEETSLDLDKSDYETIVEEANQIFKFYSKNDKEGLLDYRKECIEQENMDEETIDSILYKIASVADTYMKSEFSETKSEKIEDSMKEFYAKATGYEPPEE